MKETFEEIIVGGAYVLADLIERINHAWAWGYLTKEEREQLIDLAQINAQPDESQADLQAQVNDLYGKIGALEASVTEMSKAVQALQTAVEELGGSVAPTEPEEGDQWPEWVAWSGLGPNPWQKGSQCSHNGKRWVSQVDNNIWEPGGLGVYDTIWREAV